jgi:Effector Associated Constant Component 1
VEAELRFDGAGPDDVSVLRRMIDSDSNLRGLQLAAAGRQRPDEMSGPTLEVLQAVFGPGGTGVAFAGVLIAWLRSRRKRIRVKIQTEDGVVEVDSEGIGDPAALVERVAQVIGS